MEDQNFPNGVIDASPVYVLGAPAKQPADIHAAPSVAGGVRSRVVQGSAGAGEVGCFAGGSVGNNVATEGSVR